MNEKYNCAYSDIVSINTLVENPRNNNKHPAKQVDMLAKIIEYQGQRAPIVVSRRSGFITKGHCRLLALKKLGWEKVAVDFQDYESEAQEYADLIADNKIQSYAEFDEEEARKLLDEYDIPEELAGMEEELKKIEESKYTQKLNIPIYEPKGLLPKYSEMINTEKADKYIAEIETLNIDEEAKKFLKQTATRLYEFKYDNIAEYYAHQNKEVQDIMEKLALVIIDFNKAIENGYVQLNKFIEEEFLNEQSEEE